MVGGALLQQFLVEFLVAGAIAMVVATMVAGRIGAFGFPLPLADHRMSSVDGLRGYLALSVLCHHFFVWGCKAYLGHPWEPPSPHFVNQLGAGAVALFFMITGLVFYPRVVGGLRETSWISVYISRIFRIMPMVLISFAAVTFIVALRVRPSFDSAYFTAALGWITTWEEYPIFGYPESWQVNAYVLWSLRYEWLFYLAILPGCAALATVVQARRIPTILIPLSLLCLLIAATTLLRILGIYPLDEQLSYLSFFAVGMLAFEAQARPALRAKLTTRPMTFAAVIAIALAMVVSQTPGTWSLPLFAFFFICVACGNDIFGILRTRGARVLGECSFSIYLLHGIVLDVIFVDAHAVVRDVPLQALPLLLPAVAVVVTALTACTYLAVERPAIRAGKAIARKVSGRGRAPHGLELDVAP